MRLIVTGSRAWPHGQDVYDALSEALRAHGPFTLVHGACSTGADFYAHLWAQTHREVTEVKFKADWTRYGRKAGPLRNAEMVKTGANQVFAFSLNSPGTEGTIRLAKQAGIPVKIWRNHA